LPPFAVACKVAQGGSERTFVARQNQQAGSAMLY
jgi:hypothetical protein